MEECGVLMERTLQGKAEVLQTEDYPSGTVSVKNATGRILVSKSGVHYGRPPNDCLL